MQVGNPLDNQGKKPPAVYVVINMLLLSVYLVNATICELAGHLRLDTVLGLR
jgi:hypothetical protein